MRKTKLAKPENPDEIEMWYDDECLYIRQEKIKDILKQNNMVPDLFDKVKKD